MDDIQDVTDHTDHSSDDEDVDELESQEFRLTWTRQMYGASLCDYIIASRMAAAVRLICPPPIWIHYIIF
jgi:hypothetical protein